MRPDGSGLVWTAGGVLVERAGAPDMSTAAMDLGVIEGQDTITMPEPAWSRLSQVDQTAGDSVGVPGAVFGKRFHGLPVERELQGQDGLGDRVFLNVDGHGGYPLGEAAERAARETLGGRATVIVVLNLHGAAVEATPRGRRFPLLPEPFHRLGFAQVIGT